MRPEDLRERSVRSPAPRFTLRAMHPKRKPTTAATSAPTPRTMAMDDLAAHVPRRVAHFQGDLSGFERAVLWNCDGRRNVEEIAQIAGLATRELAAMMLALSGVGAVVLREAPPVRKISGVREKVDAEIVVLDDLDPEEIEIELDFVEEPKSDRDEAERPPTSRPAPWRATAAPNAAAQGASAPRRRRTS